MLQIKDICKYYGTNKGVEHLSIQVKKGTVLGFLGSNGSGKTTTFRILLGLLEATSGTILYQRKPIRSFPNTLMGYLPEERSLLRDLKVCDQIRYLARLKQMKDSDINIRMQFLFEALQIQQYANRKIAELSKGNQQKVQLICALIHDPEIVIFDEPLNGLDIENVQIFQEVITQLRKKQKIILISSHQYETIEQYCDQVLYLYRGDVIFQGNLLKLKQQHMERYVRFPDTFDTDFSHRKGLLKEEHEMGYTILTMASEHDALQIVKQLLRDGIYEIQVTLPSLRDIIRGYMHERTA